MGKGLLFSIVFLVCFPVPVLCEGTRQIAPSDQCLGWVCLDKSRNDFGFFGAPQDFRINIHIASTTEKVNFGLGNVYIVNTYTSRQLKYQLKDPGGNIVLGPATVPITGQGYISTYEQACAGPFPSAGGYDPVCYTPAETGDYSIEFYYPPDSISGQYEENQSLKIHYFDITVTGASGKAIDGRVWSRAWQFNCGPVQAPPTTSRFYGTMYILSDDSIVTSVNCNGFVGGTFSISSNQTGCSSTGNIAYDRQSREGFHLYPQYKIFLNDPDSLVFPTGRARPGIVLPIKTSASCNGSVDFNLSVTMNGTVEVLIDVNPSPGADPEDVILTAEVLADPGGPGYNTIHWDGNDGQGKPVANGQTLTATFRFVRGITHLPMYDIEYNDNGYLVRSVRPSGTSTDIYWDDRLIPGDSSTMNLTGCLDIAGCHLWSYGLGNVNTINSWWYVAGTDAPSVTFTLKRTPFSPGVISGGPTLCHGAGDEEFSVIADPSSTSWLWTYTGTGATINGSGSKINLVFSDSATGGTLSVAGYNQDCGSGPVSGLAITIMPGPQVTLDPPDTLCYNALPVTLAGGHPPGGEYLVNRVPAASFDPVTAGPGDHLLVYRYTDNNGCISSDSATLFVSHDEECEIKIWVPDAFTPNSDGINDIFRPVTANVMESTLTIFSRAGQILFTADDLSKGWDGTVDGQYCPAGTYIYLIVYQSSVSPRKFTTLTGSLILAR